MDRITQLGNKSIQHIHGYIDPANPHATVGSIILTSDDFAEAYRDRPGSVNRFLVDLFSFHNVIFLGFNLGDEVLLEILELVKEGRGEKQKIAESRQLPPISETVHFAILDNQIEVQINGKLLADQKEKERLIREQDVNLQYLGIHPIRYAWDENYKSVENIIDNMKALTSELDPKGSEAGDLL